MKTYSSTTLNLFIKNCPAALGMDQDGVKVDREPFQAGIAAHAVLQVVGEKGAKTRKDQEAVAKAVTEELITHGRAYNNIPEPPMSPEDAIEGRDLALAYLANNELPEGESFEVGLGMTADGEPCGYDDDECRYRAVIDQVWVDNVEDEEYAATVVNVLDFKSAWPTGPADLETLQRKGQAVLAWLHHPEADAVRRHVVNLRTGGHWSESEYLDDDGVEILKQWRSDILLACLAADETRTPRPGAGCTDCRYILQCQDAIETAVAIHADDNEAALSYAVDKAMVAEAGKLLRAETKESNIAIQGGFVGYKTKEQKKLTADAIDRLIEHWSPAASDALSEPLQGTAGMSVSEVKGLLLALNLGKTNIEKAARKLYPGRDNTEDRNALLDACLETKTVAEFNVYRG